MFLHLLLSLALPSLPTEKAGVAARTVSQPHSPPVGRFDDLGVSVLSQLQHLSGRLWVACSLFPRFWGFLLLYSLAAGSSLFCCQPAVFRQELSVFFVYLLDMVFPAYWMDDFLDLGARD